MTNRNAGSSHGLISLCCDGRKSWNASNGWSSRLPGGGGMRLRVRVGDRMDEIELSKSPILFGTLEQADVPLVGVRGVNRRHALLAHYLGGWVMHDLAALNGVR